MLMVNNPQYRQNFQVQNHRQPTPPIQHLNKQVGPPTLQYNQYQVPQASPLLAQPQYNPNISPPYPGQWQQQAPSIQSNHFDNNSDVSQILREKWEYFKFMKKRKKPVNNTKFRRKNEKRDGKKITTPRSAQTRNLRKPRGLMYPT